MKSHNEVFVFWQPQWYCDRAFGVIVRLVHCNLEVTGWSHGNKAASQEKQGWGCTWMHLSISRWDCHTLCLTIYMVKLDDWCTLWWRSIHRSRTEVKSILKRRPLVERTQRYYLSCGATVSIIYCHCFFSSLTPHYSVYTIMAIAGTGQLLPV